ncbi:hypothetical protein DYB38_002092 [Aphanomyces astaci]|uniref:MYND-type domain-containing protein n=1 Tax=Aphanomyces astaci TaxID=112090 RepID=A0A397FH76_APHAT|nr:hypothetical protein DYB38_002092 [Aphanomyces astaci]RHZ25406.1 hypothetical protein DYB31_007616 [Aphanomyces astaci]
MNADLGAQLLAAARVGDVNDLQELCANATVETVNFQDEHSGNTALHMACANGHITSVQLLLSRGAKHVANASGNSPLLQNKHLDVVKLLLTHFADNIDVLARNAFGRGCVTEAFQAENTDIGMALLLEHSSASDDKLAAGSGLATGDSKLTIEGEDDDVEPCSSKKQPKIIQETVLDFDFGATPILHARELALDMDKSAFGTTAEEDITGVSIWSASLILSRWVLADGALFAGKSVCELGAGCGVSGFATYLYTDAASVVLTDLYQHTVDNLHYNATLNRLDESAAVRGCHECGTLQRFTTDNPDGKLLLCGRCRHAAYCSRDCQKAAWKGHKGQCKQWQVSPPASTTHKKTLDVKAVDWAKPNTYGPSGAFDVVIGSDLVYHKDIVPILAQVVDAILAPRGKFLHVASTQRDSLVEFKEAMDARGFTCHAQVVPDAFKVNPLVGTNATNLFDLHFNEMEDTYCMYTFTKP